MQTETELPLSVSSRRSEIRKKPLRSELNLVSNSEVKGFPAVKRKVHRRSIPIHDQSIDSSSDEEYGRSVSHRSIHCSRIKKILSRKDQFTKETASDHRSVGDLWQDGKLGGLLFLIACIYFYYYFFRTSKSPN